MGIEPFLLVSTINVVIAQRLVRKLAKGSAKSHLSKSELEALAAHIDLDKILALLKDEKVIEKSASWEKVPFYKPQKSIESEDGYKGRVGIYEVLVVSSSIRELIMQGATSEKIEEQARKEGMLLMIEDGIFKAAQGVTTIEEVLRVVSE
jgi:type II secretory ATPase GspE/PulE/Tfp pilus assembly ATPase PilB-like protein